MFIIIMLIGGIILNTSCQNDVNPEEKSIIPSPDYKNFNTMADFNAVLDKMASINDSLDRETRLKILWDSLKENRQIPFIFDDSVTFLYRGSANSVAWAGDFNGWDPATNGWQGQKISQSNIWRLSKSLPLDARLDYKIVVNNNWMLDPSNPNQQYSGFGPNSELQMPSWAFPDETNAHSDVNKGILSDNKLISSNSENLNYDVRYKVYTPYNYAQLSSLPVIYVTDGHEYADSRLGAMINVLDNLIHDNTIEPVIAVFIDPRNPVNGNNRRMTEYRANIRFANFVADELVEAIDSAYNTSHEPSRRAILGTSLGGWNSAYFGLARSDKFNLIGIHSPAFDNEIIANYSSSPLLPLKVFMSTGTIHDTQIKARTMRDVMQSKGYQILYKEVNEGHSWGNWRALIDETLILFFEK